MSRSESAIDKLKAQRSRAVKKVLYAKKAKGDTKADLHDKATNLLIAHGISEGKSRVYAPDIVRMLQDEDMHKAKHSIRRIAIDSKINSIKDPKMSVPGASEFDPQTRKRKRSPPRYIGDTTEEEEDAPLPPERPDTEISAPSVPRSRAEAVETKAKDDATRKARPRPRPKVKAALHVRPKSPGSLTTRESDGPPVSLQSRNVDPRSAQELAVRLAQRRRRLPFSEGGQTSPETEDLTGVQRVYIGDTSDPEEKPKKRKTKTSLKGGKSPGTIISQSRPAAKAAADKDPSNIAPVVPKEAPGDFLAEMRAAREKAMGQVDPKTGIPKRYAKPSKKDYEYNLGNKLTELEDHEKALKTGKDRFGKPVEKMVSKNVTYLEAITRDIEKIKNRYAKQLAVHKKYVKEHPPKKPKKAAPKAAPKAVMSLAIAAGKGKQMALNPPPKVGRRGRPRRAKALAAAGAQHFKPAPRPAIVLPAAVAPVVAVPAQHAPLYGARAVYQGLADRDEYTQQIIDGIKGLTARLPVSNYIPNISGQPNGRMALSFGSSMGQERRIVIPGGRIETSGHRVQITVSKKTPETVRRVTAFVQTEFAYGGKIGGVMYSLVSLIPQVIKSLPGTVVITS